MANDRYCRFKVKVTVNGFTQIDGFLTASATEEGINAILAQMHAPTCYWGILNHAAEGYHINADMILGETLVAYEIECIADPYGVRESEDPLPPVPGTPTLPAM